MRVRVHGTGLAVHVFAYLTVVATDSLTRLSALNLVFGVKRILKLIL